MRFAVLAFLSLPGPKIPVRHELDVLVSTRNVLEEDFVVMDGLVGIVAVNILDDEFAFDLEKYVVGGQGSHGLLGYGELVARRNLLEFDWIVKCLFGFARRIN